MNRGSAELRTIVATVLVMLLWAFVFHVVRSSKGAILELRTSTLMASAPQLYYDTGRGFNEEQSSHGKLSDDNKRVIFPLPRGKISAYRFDPSVTAPGLQVIEAIRLHEADGSVTPIPVDRLVAANQVQVVSAAPGRITFAVAAGANDPQLLLANEPSKKASGRALSEWIAPAVVAAILSLLLLLTASSIARRKTRLETIVAVGLGIACTAAFALALQASIARPVNPDEFNHLWAGEYYLRHWLPPAVTNSATWTTVSVYGVSYLYELDVVYLLAGRLADFFKHPAMVDLTTFRLFNVAQLALLAAMAVLRPRWALPLSVLLLSPQIWYVYAYFNADALPLTVAMMVVLLAIPPTSAVAQFIDSGGRPRAAVWLFALMLGMMLVSKRNFLPLLPFLGFWLAIRHFTLGWRWATAATLATTLLLASVMVDGAPSIAAWKGHWLFLASGLALLVLCAVRLWQRARADSAGRKRLSRLLLLFAFGVLVAVPRIAYDAYLNGSPEDKQQAMTAVAEAHAGPGFKPSERHTENASGGLALAQRGTSLREIMFAPYHWLSISTHSAFGLYGYMNIMQPGWLYSALASIFSLFAAAALYATSRTRDGPAYAVLAGGFLLIVGISSLLHSWVSDLQAQGRYLLPVLPILASLLMQGRNEIPSRMFKMLLASAVLLSAYSLLVVALPALR